MPDQTPNTAQAQGVPMIAPDLSSTKLVPADQVDQAKASGWNNAYKMQGPQGEMKWVPDSQVSQARAAKFDVMPQPGTQRMATPKGQLTYATPSEVDPFKASGHVPIDDSGNFNVTPLPDEENTQTMDRAAAIAKGLPPDVLKKAIAAEQKTITPARVAANLTLGPVVAAGAGLAPLVGATEAAAAAPAIIGTVGPPAARAVGTAIRLARTPMAKAAIEYGLKAAGAGAGYAMARKWLGL